ncbi:MAG: hypothetical protein SH820_04115 [Xanthomonadales bacterium]|nr:hypothetical protein [Xanthomonadales bacterium]
MKKILLAIVTVLFTQFALAETSFSSLEEQMNGKDFQATGLEKLSASELEALNAWIRSRSLATLDTPKAGTPTGTVYSGQDGDTRGFESEQMKNADRSTITSRIVGKFIGWDGQTIFTLENGMIWEQADKDKFYVKELENPVVNIEPGAFRTWRLAVEGYATECKVKRIQ